MAPTGLVTFLFSDIEGSTKRWARDREAMQDAVRAHDRLMREAVVANRGYVFKTVGDAFCVAFATAEAAAAAAIEAQRALAAADFSAVDGIRVRMALNTGVADERDGDYFGPTLNFVARLLPLGHGGQVLVSAGTAALVRAGLPAHASLVDLGEHLLKDIEGFQRVFQLHAPGLRRDFPDLRSQQALQPWLVPGSLRTRYFTGRDVVLDQLRRQLVERHRAALSGLGGAGKTQTAIEYAVRHRTAYPNGVFWVDADTAGGLTSGFVEIANALQLGVDPNDDEGAVRAVLSRLSRMDGWLLILDNVEDRGAVRRFVPERDGGDVLITSRESVFAELGIPRALDVGELDPDDSVRFLLNRTGRTEANPDERSTAAELAAQLGHLPLALEQAAAYIAETGVSFATYLGGFRKRRIALLEKAADLVAHDTVAVTWRANFEAAERASAAAADVLRSCAFLAPDAIPFELFLDGASHLGRPIAEALAEPDDLALADVLRPLSRYSLVRSDADARSFSVHRLVQEITAAALSDAERGAYLERAVCALDASFPDVRRGDLARCERLVPHVESLERWVDDAIGNQAKFGRVLFEAASFLWERGRYGEALPLCERSLAVREKALGPDHPDVAASLNDLAILKRETGQYLEAQSFFERALAIREKVLGLVHADVADSAQGLAVLLFDRGCFPEAQGLLERTLTIRETIFGSDHAEISRSLNALAHVFYMQGRYAEAQPLFERSLAISQKALRPDHPTVARNLTGLAMLQRVQGRYAEAQVLHERALAIREKALGPDHPDVAVSLHNLAEIECDLGRHADAKPRYERALATWEKRLGPDHTNVAETLTWLASVHASQRLDAEAEQLFERAMDIWERALGPDNPGLLVTLIPLASFYKDRGRVDAALRLFERALVIKEEAYGAEHFELVELRAAIAELRAVR